MFNFELTLISVYIIGIDLFRGWVFDDNLVYGRLGDWVLLRLVLFIVKLLWINKYT